MCLDSNTSLFSDGRIAKVIYFTINTMEIFILIVGVQNKLSLAWRRKVEKIIFKVCAWC